MANKRKPDEKELNEAGVETGKPARPEPQGSGGTPPPPPPPKPQ